MKKFNKNVILFVAVAVFWILGLCSKPLLVRLAHCVSGLYQDVVSGKENPFDNFTKMVDSSSELLQYHDEMLDIGSVKEKLLGTRILYKNETTVVKADSGALLGYLITDPPTKESVEDWIINIKQCQAIAEANGAGFLYCMIPEKLSYEKLPPNFVAYNIQRMEQYTQAIVEHNIPYLDSGNLLEECGMSGEDIFFRTDHHWTPLAGFYVHGGICKKLQEYYGFEYNAEYIKLENYNIKTYENWFLGSYGKKCGTYFTGAQVDDFDLITPKFNTNFTEEIPTYNSVRNGSFENTMLHKEHLVKGYYKYNTYATYSGGDFRLQRIVNNSLENGKTIVVIRQSYGCVVTPFLALHAKELHVIDPRAGSYPIGEIIDIEAYIQEIQPDYVIYLM